MGVLDWLFGRRRAKYGRIYCMRNVLPAHADAAQSAISSDRYTVHASHNGGARAVLILSATPPLVALVRREASMSGGAPDLVVTAVYDVTGDPAVLAAELWEYE